MRESKESGPFQCVKRGIEWKVSLNSNKQLVPCVGLLPETGRACASFHFSFMGRHSMVRLASVTVVGQSMHACSAKQSQPGRSITALRHLLACSGRPPRTCIQEKLCMGLLLHSLHSLLCANDGLK